MQRLEVSGAVRLMYRSLGVKGLNREHCCKYFSSYEISAAGYLCVSCNVLRTESNQNDKLMF